MIDIIDSDSQDRISQTAPRQESKSKKKMTLPRRPGYSSNKAPKYFLDEPSKESPTFSPLNSVENKRELYNNSTNRIKVTDHQGLNLECSAPSFDPHSNAQKYRNRYNIRNDTASVYVPQEFSPYKKDQGGMMRRARHSSYFNGKENTNSFNHTSGVRLDESSFAKNKSRGDRMPSNPYAESHSRVRDGSQLMELQSVYRESKRDNEEMKILIGDLQRQLKETKQRENANGKTLQLLRSEFGDAIVNVGTCSEFIKRSQRKEALLGSISDMKMKITGKSETNLKELWRWLKTTVQELGSKRQITNWLKQDYLGVSKQAPDDIIRAKLLGRSNN